MKVAALVCLWPGSKGFEVWIIMIVTYLIAIGGSSHVVVGSVEAFLLFLDGQAGVAQVLGFLLPALVGNIIGGTALFSLLAYGQVREEIDWPRKCPDYRPGGCGADAGVIGKGNGKQHE